MQVGAKTTRPCRRIFGCSLVAVQAKGHEGDGNGEEVMNILRMLQRGRPWLGRVPDGGALAYPQCGKACAVAKGSEERGGSTVGAGFRHRMRQSLNDSGQIIGDGRASEHVAIIPRRSQCCTQPWAGDVLRANQVSNRLSRAGSFPRA